MHYSNHMYMYVYVLYACMYGHGSVLFLCLYCTVLRVMYCTVLYCIVLNPILELFVYNNVY